MNSSPKPGTTIRQYVWAVASMPDRQSVANATGKVAQVRLPPGSYMVGLLVLDSSYGNAIALKNFIVAGPQGSGSSQSPAVSVDRLVLPDATGVSTTRAPSDGAAAAIAGMSPKPSDSEAVPTDSAAAAIAGASPAPTNSAAPATAAAAPAVADGAVAAAVAPAQACPSGSLGPARVTIRYRPNSSTDLCLTATASSLIVSRCTGQSNQIFRIVSQLFLKRIKFEHMPSAVTRASCISVQGSLQNARDGTVLQLQDCAAALEFSWGYPGLAAPYSFRLSTQTGLLAMDVNRNSVSRRAQLARLSSNNNIWGLVAA